MVRQNFGRVNTVEAVICILLLLMGVPDLCRKLGRPALANAFFVVFGILLAQLLQSDVLTMVKQVGEVGFLLVFFEVGLEIQLPKLRELVPSMRYAMAWVVIQYPPLLALTQATGFSLGEGLVMTAALTGCSMSMAFAGWKNFFRSRWGSPKFYASNHGRAGSAIDNRFDGGHRYDSTRHSMEVAP